MAAVVLQVPLGDLLAGRKPDIAELLRIGHEIAQRADAERLTYDVRIDNKMETLDGGPYPYQAKDLYEKLDEWIKRPTPFYLHDIRDQVRLVKITNASEVRAQRDRNAAYPSYDSVMRLAMTEVNSGFTQRIPVVIPF